jgi:uncharacterized phage protein (TIGR01671 family)
MRRAIKFRAWHEGRKEWLHDSRPPCGGCSILGEWCRVPLEELNDVVVEQFTGLQDSKGRDIYEGDIVSGKNSYDRGAVVWSTYEDDEYVEKLETWMVEMPFRAPLSSLIKSRWRTGRYSRGSMDGSLEIVGNIHEHGNLLTR